MIRSLLKEPESFGSSDIDLVAEPIGDDYD